MYFKNENFSRWLPFKSILQLLEVSKKLVKLKTSYSPQTPKKYMRKSEFYKVYIQKHSRH